MASSSHFVWRSLMHDIRPVHNKLKRFPVLLWSKRSAGFTLGHANTEKVKRVNCSKRQQISKKVIERLWEIDNRTLERPPYGGYHVQKKNYVGFLRANLSMCLCLTCLAFSFVFFTNLPFSSLKHMWVVEILVAVYWNKSPRFGGNTCAFLVCNQYSCNMMESDALKGKQTWLIQSKWQEEPHGGTRRAYKI